MKATKSISLQQLEDFHLDEESALNKLNEFDHYIDQRNKKFLGYPCNGALKLKAFFQWWEQSVVSKSPLNDVGCPESTTLYALNARPFEVTVLQYFARLFAIDPHWGYITSGGTQGNEQGLYIGREVLAKYGEPILYFSEEAHYSISSLGRLLGLECRKIATTANGEMDYQDLGQKLVVHRPALFSISIGTTFKGSIDRLESIQQVVKQSGLMHVYYHADAALFGGFLPFYPDPQKPDLNFQKFPYDSIAVSGHKFFGSPVPLGIFLTRSKNIQALKSEYIEYLQTYNLTIPCSRSSLNSLIFWWIVRTTPIEQLIQESKTIIENARYFYEQMKIRNHPVWLNPFSNTIYFSAPSLEFCKRWTLSLYTCRHLGHLAHAIMMQHVDKAMIDDFMQELEVDIKRKEEEFLRIL